MNTSIYRRQTTHSTFPFTRFLPFFLWGIVGILLVLQVVVSNSLATTGFTVTEVENEIEVLTQENTQFEEKIASASALKTVQDKVTKLGFTKPITPLFMQKTVPIARSNY